VVEGSSTSKWRREKVVALPLTWDKQKMKKRFQSGARGLKVKNGLAIIQERGEFNDL